ncbi:hypothetical protein TI39_contig469g00008 [Zymoseptoria brevis]|uniref:Uncharacterized protein n=1 Tax=Zymoseptoria brevis TaxID=1047168 RepID=A0A0F4GJX9_9PEZI|nr:hypothetical protein TI39_contig469g00008 [Zymoseptoria brevis]
MASLSSTRYMNASCPLGSGYKWPPTFLTATATSCGAKPCCTFQPIVAYEYTWQSVSKQPVTVGTEVVIIDTALGITTTTTEIITTGIVVTLPGEPTPTTLDPSQWLSNGGFDPGYDVPTRSTILTDSFDNVQTIRYPSGYVDMEAELRWYGSIPIVSAGTTSCYQNTAKLSSIASPTYISTQTQTVDPEDPKGIFYSYGATKGLQMPGASGGSCGGVYATQLLQSWNPTDLVVSVYSSCLCSGAVPLPATPLNTASFLLASTTRFARLGSVAATTTAEETTSTSRAAPVEPVPDNDGGSTSLKQPEPTSQPSPEPAPEQNSQPAPRPTPEPVQQTTTPLAPKPVPTTASRADDPVGAAPEHTSKDAQPEQPETKPAPDAPQQQTPPSQPTRPPSTAGSDTAPDSTDEDTPAPQPQTQPAPQSPEQTTPTSTDDLSNGEGAPESDKGYEQAAQPETTRPSPVPGAPLQTATRLVRPSGSTDAEDTDAAPDSPDAIGSESTLKPTSVNQAGNGGQPPSQPLRPSGTAESIVFVTTLAGGTVISSTRPAPDQPPNQPLRPSGTTERLVIVTTLAGGNVISTTLPTFSKSEVQTAADGEQTQLPVVLNSGTLDAETSTSHAGIGDFIAGGMGETKSSEPGSPSSTTATEPSGEIAGSVTASNVPLQYTGAASRLEMCGQLLVIVFAVAACL